MMSAAVELHDIKKSFGSVSVIDGVDLDLDGSHGGGRLESSAATANRFGPTDRQLESNPVLRIGPGLGGRDLTAAGDQ